MQPARLQSREKRFHVFCVTTVARERWIIAVLYGLSGYTIAHDLIEEVQADLGAAGIPQRSHTKDRSMSRRQRRARVVSITSVVVATAISTMSSVERYTDSNALRYDLAGSRIL
jgi:hypothetical protein